MDTNIQLTDGLITLRPPCPADVPEIHLAVQESLTELSQWMDWATPNYNEHSIWRWLEHVTLAWEHSSGFQFAITDSATGQYLGNCGVDGIDEKLRCCNISYWVRTSRTGQGIASRATRLAARFAFETVKLVRAEISMAAENTASQRAAQKAGARFESLQPDRCVVRLAVYDAVIYALTPEDLGPAASQHRIDN